MENTVSPVPGLASSRETTFHVLIPHLQSAICTHSQSLFFSTLLSSLGAHSRGSEIPIPSSPTYGCWAFEPVHTEAFKPVNATIIRRISKETKLNTLAEGLFVVLNSRWTLKVKVKKITLLEIFLGTQRNMKMLSTHQWILFHFLSFGDETNVDILWTKISLICAILN